MFLVGLHLQELLIIKFMECDRIYFDYNASSLIRKEAFNLLEEINFSYVFKVLMVFTFFMVIDGNKYLDVLSIQKR